MARFTLTNEQLEESLFGFPGNKGICLECGDDEIEGVEPDATNYPCPVCDARAVWGWEQAALAGKVDLI